MQAYDDAGMESVFVDDYIDFEGVMFDPNDPPYKVTARVIALVQDESGESFVTLREGDILGIDPRS